MTSQLTNNELIAQVQLAIETYAYQLVGLNNPIDKDDYLFKQAYYKAQILPLVQEALSYVGKADNDRIIRVCKGRIETRYTSAKQSL